MEKIKIFTRKHPVIFGILFFGILSLVLNTIWILLFKMAHVYDIVHVFPIALMMEPILKAAGGVIPTQFVLVPMAVIMDMVMGAVATVIIWKITKKEKTYMLSLTLVFAIYWILITYQWLPLFG
ncbi:MAG: hypothetical protein RR131_02740 [Anaerovorax sp.]